VELDENSQRNQRLKGLDHSQISITDLEAGLCTTTAKASSWWIHDIHSWIRPQVKRKRKQRLEGLCTARKSIADS